MVDPVRRGAAGPECVLQAAVEAFYHPVGLRVVGGGLVVLDVEEAAESGPQGPAVRCDDCWDPIAAHPSLKQCIGAVYCCGVI